MQAVGMSYLKGDCGVNKVDGERNENVYGRFGMAIKEGVSYIFCLELCSMYLSISYEEESSK